MPEKHGKKKLGARVAPSVAAGEDATDNDVIVFLQSPRAAAAIRAKLRQQRAKGIPITFMRGTAIVKRYPDGREEKLGEVARPKYRLPADVSIISPL